jgi:hypothetical protein
MGKKWEKNEKKKKRITQRFMVNLHSKTLSRFSFFLMFGYIILQYINEV